MNVSSFSNYHLILRTQTEMAVEIPLLQVIFTGYYRQQLQDVVVDYNTCYSFTKIAASTLYYVIEDANHVHFNFLKWDFLSSASITTINYLACQ